MCFLVDIFIFTAGLSENGIASARRGSHLGAARVGRIIGTSYGHCSGYTFIFILAVLTCERWLYLCFSFIIAYQAGFMAHVDVLWVF